MSKRPIPAPAFVRLADQASDPAPLGIDEPLVYWRPGTSPAAKDLASDGTKWTGEAVVYYSSERAAWLAREGLTRVGFPLDNRGPSPRTAAQCMEFARLAGARFVRIRDESGQVVDSWEVA